MQQVRLGASGLSVSRICLGTMTFGREADETESFTILDHYLEAGGTFLDTANGYSGGGSEALLGRWLRDRGVRERMVVATKVFARMGDGGNEHGLSRIHIQQAVEASLRRLGTDALDLYQIHRWDLDTPPEETLSALDQLVRQGKVRYLGCSNLKAWHLARFLSLATEGGLHHFISLQPLYNALNRTAELELLELCDQAGIGVIPYNPLAGGMLTGKYTRGAALPEAVRLAENPNYHDRYYADEVFDVVEGFVLHAGRLGLTPAQLALAWVLANPAITAPIVGARTLVQLKDTLGGLEARLTPEQLGQIPAVKAGGWVGRDPVYQRHR